MFAKKTLTRAVAALYNLTEKEAEAKIGRVIVFGPPALRCERCEHFLCEFCFMSGVTTCDGCNHVDESDIDGHFDSDKEMLATSFEDVCRVTGVSEEDSRELLARVGETVYRRTEDNTAWEKYAHIGCAAACQVTIPKDHMAALEAWLDKVRKGDGEGAEHGGGIRTGVTEEENGISYHYAIRHGQGGAVADLLGIDEFDVERDDCEKCRARERALSEGREARRASRRALSDDVWGNREVVERAVEALGEDAFRFVQLVAQAAAENPQQLAKAWQARSVTAVVDALQVEI